MKALLRHHGLKLSGAKADLYTTIGLLVTVMRERILRHVRSGQQACKWYSVDGKFI
jgi:hypothetical protein